MNIAAPNRRCPECGEPFRATHGRQAFCSTAHKETFHNRKQKRGKVVMSLAQVWRAGKNGKGGDNARYAFAEMCALLDKWNAEDKAAGRRPDIEVSSRRANMWSASDLAVAP